MFSLCFDLSMIYQPGSPTPSLLLDGLVFLCWKKFSPFPLPSSHLNTHVHYSTLQPPLTPIKSLNVPSFTIPTVIGHLLLSLVSSLDSQSRRDYECSECALIFAFPPLTCIWLWYRFIWDKPIEIWVWVRNLCVSFFTPSCCKSHFVVYVSWITCGCITWWI